MDEERKYNDRASLRKGLIMFSFGKASTKHLVQLSDNLQAVLVKAIKTSPLDFCLISSHRGKVEQNKYFDDGTGLEWPNSKHNVLPAEAVDFAPYHKINPHIRWEAIDEFVIVAKHIIATAEEMGIVLRSGRDWDRDDVYNEKGETDGPHIEEVTVKPKSSKKKKEVE